MNPGHEVLLVALARAIIDRGHDPSCGMNVTIGEAGPWRKSDRCTCGMDAVKKAFDQAYEWEEKKT